MGFSSLQGQIRILNLEQGAGCEFSVLPSVASWFHIVAIFRAGPPSWFSANQRSTSLGCVVLKICPNRDPYTGSHLLGLSGHIGARLYPLWRPPNPTQGYSLETCLPFFSAQVIASVTSFCEHPAESSVMLKQRIFTSFPRLTGRAGKGSPVLIPPTGVGGGNRQTKSSYIFVNHLSYCRFL